MKFWSIPLLPFAWLYGAVLAVRNVAYDRGWMGSEWADPVLQDKGLPVISIGNITAGGTGKTPMAEFLLAKLVAMGYRPAYLSRGYGRQTKGFRMVRPAEGGAAQFGDEAFQVANRFPSLPVAVCEDRITGARTLLATERPDVLVLDDAFQHRRIRRNLDWVMVDATRMPTDDAPIPAGRLREFLGGLRRADTLILTKYKDVTTLDRHAATLRRRFPAQALAALELRPQGLHPFFASADLTLPDLDNLQGQQAVVFSGIGNNAHFAQTLSTLGITALQTFTFPDHYAYREADIEKILADYESLKEIKGKLRPVLILTTEKDYFRLKGMPWMQRFEQLPWSYLAVGMEPIWGWEEMELKLKKIIKNS